ncbi:hypothetical protein QJQ45_003206 [Haematococcus lacustris]|nr:hypothetical protein QJQ45_003206 [Haematococcus lacustris]
MKSCYDVRVTMCPAMLADDIALALVLVDQMDTALAVLQPESPKEPRCSLPEAHSHVQHFAEACGQLETLLLCLGAAEKPGVLQQLQQEVEQLEAELQGKEVLLQKCHTRLAAWQKTCSDLKAAHQNNLSGVWFFDCYPLDRGAKKDARFYADMHNEMANKVQLISKVLSDCGKIRCALNCAQMSKYNKVQAVATHCATRFAILYLICVDLKRSQDALVMMPVPPFDSLSEQQQADLAPTVSRLAGASIGAAIRELNAFENAEWNAAMKRRAQSMLQMQTLQQPTQPGQPSFTPIASIEARQSFWKLQAAPQFPILAKAAQRLLSAHASTAAAERNWSMWGHTYHNALRNNFSVEAAKREVYLKANVPTTDSDDDTPAVQDTLIDIMN